MSSINICIIKRVTTETPYVFEDTALSVREQLALVGLNTIFSVNRILPEIPNIVFGAGAPGGPTISELRSLTRPDNTIIFNLEQLGGGGPWDNEDYFELLSNFRTFDYNHRNVEFMRRLSPRYKGIEFPIYPSETFRSSFQPNQTVIKYDACFYGGLNSRRNEILNNLSSQGIRLKIINGHFGQALADQLTDCKCVLNIHFYETAILEIARLLRPVMMGIPVLSENSVMPRSVSWSGKGVHFVDFLEPDTVRRFLADEIAIRNLKRSSARYFSNSSKVEKAFLALDFHNLI
jgi:hypothetical protein